MSLPAESPSGLRVLLVDDDLVSLNSTSRMLEQCSYQVTCFNEVDDALTELRSSCNKFDILMMSAVNDLTLVKVSLQMDMSVIADDEDIPSAIEGVSLGVYYLVKPVTMESVQTVWVHVFGKKNYCLEGTKKRSVSKKRKTTKEGGEKQVTPTLKKARLVWSTELDAKFVDVVLKIGIHKAVPKQILELMNEPGLTRENVASHLQKYREKLKKKQRTKVEKDVANQQHGWNGNTEWRKQQQLLELRKWSMRKTNGFSPYLGNSNTAMGGGDIMNGLFPPLMNTYQLNNEMVFHTDAAPNSTLGTSGDLLEFQNNTFYEDDHYPNQNATLTIGEVHNHPISQSLNSQFNNITPQQWTHIFSGDESQQQCGQVGNPGVGSSGLILSRVYRL